ncbi:MAG: MBL fold metallo-hydrolase [Rubrivivax sp.]|nr:MBL fold metallo-hydrolase [Rubrivivax sp.]
MRPSRLADIQALADGVWLLPGRFERDRQPDGNSVLLQGREGLVLIDSGRHAEHTGALVEWARSRGQPIRVVLNTHWHLDHLGGNVLLRGAMPGLRAMASAAVREAVAVRMPRTVEDLRRMLAEPGLDVATRRMVDIDLALLQQRAQLAPDELVADAPHDLSPAGRPLRVGVERGVSGGDLWVLDRASGTLVIGDFVTLPVPFFDTACAELWREALARLGELPFTRVVPGHGPVMDAETFRRYVRAYGRLVDCSASQDSVAACATRWAEDLGPLLPEASRRGAEAMLGHYFETVLRAPPPQRRRHCPA